MKIKEFPKEGRPRERFIAHGPEALSDAELFAIILRNGTRSENVIDMSQRLLKEYGLTKLFDCSLSELQEIHGIGEIKGMQILSMSELTKRYGFLKEDIKSIGSAKDVFLFFRNRLSDAKQEHFMILMLNNRNYIIGDKLITKGVLDAALIHPREVFKEAIKHSASKIILVHNHPSGDPTPSKEDLDVTRELMQASELLGIPVIDHIIIGRDSFWSFQKEEAQKRKKG